MPGPLKTGLGNQEDTGFQPFQGSGATQVVDAGDGRKILSPLGSIAGSRICEHPHRVSITRLSANCAAAMFHCLRVIGKVHKRLIFFRFYLVVELLPGNTP